LLTKVFQGSSYMELRKEIMARFEELHVRKPSASRDRSAETYLLARGKHD
jgi:23S rRNA (uridine2552-2'-O)-methyltransferase